MRATAARRRAERAQPRSATLLSSDASKARASARRCDLMSPLCSPPPPLSGARGRGGRFLELPDPNSIVAGMVQGNLPKNENSGVPTVLVAGSGKPGPASAPCGYI